MCGFFFLRSLEKIEKKQLILSTNRVKLRGPDGEGFLHYKSNDGFNNYFLHFLLDISGKKIFQPIENNKDILLFNGEIYNYNKKKYSADTNYLLDSSYEYENLNGEYAYIKFKKENNTCFAVTDTFMTKPIFFGFNKQKKIYGIASYKSALEYFDMEIINFQPNTITKFSFDRESFFKEDFKKTIRKFNLSQNIKNFEEWENFFLKEVKKRATHGKIKPFVSLSSGYDSGAICCALNLLNIKYETFSILKNENFKIIKERINLNKKKSCIKENLVDGLDFFKKKKIEKDIKRNIDDFEYFHQDRKKFLKLSQDGGSIGALEVAKHAKENNFKVHLSSCGADEIISDYGHNGKKYFSHSEFGGLFPEKLETIFPWKKFYGDSQRSYLFKEEYTYGRYGLESRYPFLDNDLVQSFLNLSSHLKNFSYKAPIAYFLKKHNYPFEENKKRGFNPRSYGIFERIISKINFLES